MAVMLVLYIISGKRVIFYIISGKRIIFTFLNLSVFLSTLLFVKQELPVGSNSCVFKKTNLSIDTYHYSNDHNQPRIHSLMPHCPNESDRSSTGNGLHRTPRLGPLWSCHRYHPRSHCPHQVQAQNTYSLS